MMGMCHLAAHYIWV